MNRKGFFFLVDGILAVVILLIGALLISSKAEPPRHDVPVSAMAENLADLLGSAAFTDLCHSEPGDSCACSGPQAEAICLSGALGNPNQSLLHTIGELYTKGRGREAGGMAAEAIGPFAPGQFYGFMLIVNDDIIYTTSPVAREDQRSRELISVKRVVFGTYDLAASGTVGFWGPLLLEVRVWLR